MDSKTLKNLIVVGENDAVVEELRAYPAEPSWLEYIFAKGQTTRGDIDSLLMKHLSATLTDRQKRTKIGNLLSLKLNKRVGFIQNCGNDRKSAWILTDKGVRECKRSNPGCKRTCKRMGL